MKNSPLLNSTHIPSLRHHPHSQNNSRSGFDTGLRNRAATAVTYPNWSTGNKGENPSEFPRQVTSKRTWPGRGGWSGKSQVGLCLSGSADHLMLCEGNV
ncbi:hypothetical protein E2C01_033026 [Portunus trituberculatus]|uniref:Uncharacterized protein n=1 Tax=Portunus trituberculatus TaxID=210409 RepID=A0A5B7F2V0_PORTR|nr:hypothetical protein [Portunus trituberculatus]